MLKQWSHATAALIFAATLSACGGGNAPDEAAEAPASQQSSPGMAGMQGMQGMAERAGTVDPMQAHMRMMKQMDGEQMKKMLPEHRQMAANMIAGFNQEMKGMNMATDASWNATVDSLRQDLVRMPEMAPNELQAFFPAHEARLERLMESHRGMMGSMKM